jgi:putative ABC transport system permease protein
MRPTDLFKFALKALRERKLRAILTIIGIVIGPATIVALVGATQGFSSASSARFQSLGATTIFVSPVGRQFSLTASTVQQIQGLQGVAYAVPYQEAGGTITQGGETISVQIIALDLSQLDHIFPSLTLGQGSIPSASDLVGAAVGYSIAHPDISGATNVSVGQVIVTSSVRSTQFAVFAGAGGSTSFSGGASSGGTQKSFLVRGIFNSFGQGLFVNPDDSIFVQQSDGQAVLHASTYNGVIVVATSASTVTQVTNELTSEFGQNIRATAVTSLTSTIQSITQGVSTLLEAVAGTSVIVAFVGIMTTMLTSVLERTTEIGVLKSLGASSRSIMLAFITEASVTGLIGGVVGAGAGAALSYVIVSLFSGSLRLGGGGLGGGVTSRAGAGGPAGVGPAFASSSSASTTLTITPVITPELLIIAILIATAVGTLGGILPAWRASRLTPVEALHRS